MLKHVSSPAESHIDVRDVTHLNAYNTISHYESSCVEVYLNKDDTDAMMLHRELSDDINPPKNITHGKFKGPKMQWGSGCRDSMQ
jgi:hypothetical protein